MEVDHKSTLIYLEETEVGGQSASTYCMTLYAKLHCSRVNGGWKTRMGHSTCPCVYSR